MLNVAFFKNTFSDNPVKGFLYNTYDKKLILYYEEYFDLDNRTEVTTPCALVIEKWQTDYSMPYSLEGHYPKKYDLDKFITVFDILLDIELNDTFVVIAMQSLGGEYFVYEFEKPVISLALVKENGFALEYLKSLEI